MNTTIPVTARVEVLAWVETLGMKDEYEQMIGHTLRTVPRLKSVEVVLEDPYEMGDVPRVVLETTLEGPPRDEDYRISRDWGSWKIDTFPPEVCQHFLMMIHYGIDA